MSTRKLDREAWGQYFDGLSRKMAQNAYPEYAEIRVFSMEDGAQRETSWLPLTGITYDRKGDLLEVIVEGMDHMILHPEEIYVDEEGEELLSFEVVRKDGTKEVVEVR